MTLRSPVLAIAVLAALPGAAIAQSPAPQPTPSLSSLSAKLEKDGFTIHEIERYAHSIEVKGRDKSGVCVELHLDPKTGDVLSRERDDDCENRSDDRGRHERR